MMADQSRYSSLSVALTCFNVGVILVSHISAVCGMTLYSNDRTSDGMIRVDGDNTNYAEYITPHATFKDALNAYNPVLQNYTALEEFIKRRKVEMETGNSALDESYTYISGSRGSKRSLAPCDMCSRSLCPWDELYDIQQSQTPNSIAYANCTRVHCNYNVTELNPDLVSSTGCEPIRIDFLDITMSVFDGSEPLCLQHALMPINFLTARRNSLDSSASVQGSTVIEEEYKFVEVSHPAQVLTGLNHLKQSQQFCDVIICAGGQEFSCHKIVLASFSPYFNAMFTGNLAESTQNKVTINDVDGPVMELLVNYAYTSEIQINRQNVQSLLSASNLLEILPVKEACGQYLDQNMDETNAIGIHCFAEAHACTELQQKSRLYIIQNFLAVSLQEEYLQITQEKLQEFLMDDELNIDSEEQVFQSAVRWLDYDIEGRKTQFENVLEHVRLPLTSPYYLYDVVEKHEVICKSEKCKQLVDEAKTYLLLHDRHPELQSPRTQLRKSLGYMEVIICVGGEDDKVVLRSVEMFDPDTCRWKPLACLPFAISKHGMVSSGDNYLYLAGGEFPDGSASRSMWRFDQSLDTWMEMVPMNMARSELGLAILDGHVYAIGGWDGSSRLDSVEKYDPVLNTWTFIPPMKIALTSPAIVSLHGLLYVTGGAVLEDGDGIDMVQCYNPRRDMWIDKPSMQIARSGSAACVLDGLIYVIGGWHASTENTNKVECYDPERNEWSQKASMLERRYRPGVAVIGNNIYVCGGEEGWDRYHDTIECYNSLTDVWEIVGEMLTSRSWLSCVSMRIRKDMNNAECHNKCTCSV